ncbi:hypothetical protein [Bacillus sp. FJAT-27251]|uniref:hypothetical protein n=1 Tax=Bacillus sp. FJAT-27251 TaxID=1684142 RepID=UPI0006A7590F|nr:hypothetical protein [Bacillus sp. FJAT-27251]
MNKKLLAVIGGTILSASLVTGCGVNNDNNPAPPNDNDGAEINRYDRDNRIFNNNNDRGIFDNRDDRYDMNTRNDGDMMRDNNTPGEDLMEDGLDRNDRNDRDR